jgi:tartrate-resistant acid phosphatase type 5
MTYFRAGKIRFRRTDVACLALFLVITFAGALVRAQDQQSDSVRFLVVSDWGGRASKAQKAVASAMAQEAVRIDAQFVVTAGDNYHGSGIGAANDPRWRTEYEDVYSQKALQIPWYASLGNHDYAGNVEAEIEYSKISKRWKLPSRYYAQTVQVDRSNSILIAHIDTSPMKRKFRKAYPHYRSDELDPERQLRWLDSTLANSQSRWKIVIGHHPIYSAAKLRGDSKQLKRMLLPILKKHRVPLYISGHDHVLQHLRHGDMNFIICGTGAKQWYVGKREDVVFGSRSLGFLSVIVTGKSIQVNMVDETGTTLHRVSIEAPASDE